MNIRLLQCLPASVKAFSILKNTRISFPETLSVTLPVTVIFIALSREFDNPLF